MKELTEEQKKDIDSRREEFLKRYEAIVTELQMDFASFPQYVPMQDGKCGTVIVTQIVDKKYISTPSPIIMNS